MKNLRTLNSSINYKELTKVIKTSKGEVEFIPTFNRGDTVTVKDSIKNLNDSSVKRIKGLTLLVDYCKVADLGNMVVEVLYLQKTIKEVQNPYLIEHFEKVI